MIKAILFDMNGVIIDDEHVHEKAFCETVKSHGIDLTHEDYLVCCAGKTDRAGYEHIARFFHREMPIDRLLMQKSQMYLQLFPQHKRSYDGVLDLIQRLAQSYIVALTSSSSRKEVDLIVEEFGLKKYFAITISGDDVHKGKPYPEPYIKTAQLLHVSPQECVVIEDSENGIRAAKSAGCCCIAITTTHTKADLWEADVLVDSFWEISDDVINSLSL